MMLDAVRLGADMITVHGVSGAGTSTDGMIVRGGEDRDLRLGECAAHGLRPAPTLKIAAIAAGCLRLGRGLAQLRGAYIHPAQADSIELEEQ